ncbi:MAG: hypothetical protein Q9202_000973 [Teloschistes flavicans]
MSDQSRPNYNLFSNQAGTHGVNEFNMFSGNPLIDMQPNFGQTWSGSPGWGTVFDATYQNGWPGNNDYSQTQQTDPVDHDENDDFYDNEDNQSISIISQVKPNGSQIGSRIAPLTPQAQAITMPPQKGLSTTTQLDNQANTHNNKHTASPLPGAEAASRAAELREKLLANKRGSSATPVPSAATRKPNVIREAAYVTQGSKDGVNSHGKPYSTDATLETNPAVIATASGQLVDKSLHNPPNVPRSSSATADIEGLIGEYRVPEASKQRAIPVGETAKVHQPQPPSIPSKSITTTPPLRLQRQSTDSAESGEIHSDQELEFNIKGRDQGRSVIEKAKGEVRKGPQKSAAIGVAKQGHMPDTHQSQSSPLKQAPVPETSRQNSLSQAVGRRAIVQPASKPRDIILAQRADLVRKEARQSPSPRGVNGTNTQRHDNGSKGQDRGVHKLSDPITVAERSQSETSLKTIVEAPKHQHGREQEMIEEHATVHEKPVAEQLPAGPQQRPASVEQDIHQDKHAVEHNKPQTTNSLTLEDPAAKQKDQQCSQEIRSVDDHDTKFHTLTTAQYQQLCKLGVDLGPRGFDDLCDFLEHHKFHVESYRRKALARRKQFQAVEAEERAVAAKRFALECETQLEFNQFHTMPAHFLVSSESTKPVVSVHGGAVDSPSRKPMPPPLNVSKSLGDQGAATAIVTTGNTPAIHVNGHIAPRRDLPSDTSNSKRQHVDDDMELERSAKVARVDYDSRSYNRSRPVSPKTSRSEAPLRERRYSSDYRPARGNRSRSPRDFRRSLSPYRRDSDTSYPHRQNWTYSSGRIQIRPPPDDGDTRQNIVRTRCQECDRFGHLAADCPDDRRGSRTRPGASYHDRAEPAFPPPSSHSDLLNGHRGKTRGGRAGYHNNKLRMGFLSNNPSPAPKVAIGKGSKVLNLAAGDSRYFMIKSWNVENVEAAQRDSIWATQSKNLDILTEAFNTCRNVILVFSVNNSKAFQGYARMQSLPSSDIPSPAWQKALRWSTTDPFRIEWVAIAETLFNRVGHLKNALNEGHAVLVGRDGQEIEGVCGRELCILMDEEAREQERFEMDY